MDNFEEQHLAAVKRGQENIANSPEAKKVSFDRKNRRLAIDLQNGTTFIVPVNLIQILQNADDDEIADVDIKVHGLYLSWNALDEDLTVAHLISGVFGTQKWMNNLQEHLAEAGRKGGASRSEAKRRASAENGKKGGRPKKVA
jgi:hypothetical protein